VFPAGGAEALTLAEMKKPDLIIADIWMPVGMGFSLAHRLKESAPRIPIIFITASRQAGLRATAKEFGAVGFLEKPYDPEVLLETISQILQSAGSPDKEADPAPTPKTD
jgi:two-component system response regulator FlrC